MTSMTRRRLRLTSGLAAAALSLGLLAACSDPSHQATDQVSQGQANDFRQEQARLRDIDRAYAELPSRPSGVVDIDGTTSGSLTPNEVASYEATANAAQIRVADNGEDQAFQELCAGRIDLVDSARPISRAEWEACQAVGLDVVQFQVAAEAIVVAIKSETDVGADCLSVDQVRDICRAGSPLTNWSQEPLGFDDVPLKVGGPGRTNSGFGFFGRYVLDAPEPSRMDLRSDYYLAADDEAARLFVVGKPWTAARAARFDDARASGPRPTRRSRTRARSCGGPRTSSPPHWPSGPRASATSAAPRTRPRTRPGSMARLRRRGSRRITRYHAEPVRYTRVTSATGRSATRGSCTTPTAGTSPTSGSATTSCSRTSCGPSRSPSPDGQGNCIFPSQRTITSGEYPLARQLLITDHDPLAGARARSGTSCRTTSRPRSTRRARHDWWRLRTRRCSSSSPG